MVVPNIFLLNNVVSNGTHVLHCFCEVCRHDKVADILNSGFTNIQLYDRFFRELLDREDVRLNRLFKNTLQRILFRKAFSDACISNTRYTRFGCWARTQTIFTQLAPNRFRNICKQVNEVDAVFTDWDIIVSNLTDARVNNIDARKLSVNQLYRARKMSWCIDHNEMQRTPGRNEEPAYPEFKYQNILRYIAGTGIYEDVENDPTRVTMIGRRLQSDMTKAIIGERIVN